MRHPPDAEEGPRQRALPQSALRPGVSLAGQSTAAQPELWDDPEVDLHRVGHAGPQPPRARSRDRATSGAAAASLDPARVGAQCQAVLDVLRRAACQGATRDEIADALDWRGDRSVLSRRVTDLVQGGLALDIGHTRPGHSGRSLTVWGAKGACGGGRAA